MWTRRSFELVAIDYGGVLTNPIVDTIRQFSLAVDIPIDALLGAIVAAAAPGDNTIMAALERGQITEVAAIERVSEALAPQFRERFPKPPEFRNLWLHGRTPNHAMIAAVLGIRSQLGVDIALASNNVVEWESDWRKLVAAIPFDYEILSCDHGTRKPEAKFFETLATETGREPGDILFIDDVLENVVAARDFGIRAELFTGHHEFESRVHAWAAPMKEYWQ